MTKEELVNKLKQVGINGEWINRDEWGFSRLFQFKLGEQTIQIEWYWNYSTLIIENIHFWFDKIRTSSCYPYQGKWIEFSFRNESPLHLRVQQK